jgi:hypothetical protein
LSKRPTVQSIGTGGAASRRSRAGPSKRRPSAENSASKLTERRPSSPKNFSKVDRSGRADQSISHW